MEAILLLLQLIVSGARDAGLGQESGSPAPKPKINYTLSNTLNWLLRQNLSTYCKVHRYTDTVGEIMAMEEQSKGIV